MGVLFEICHVRCKCVCNYAANMCSDVCTFRLFGHDWCAQVEPESILFEILSVSFVEMPSGSGRLPHVIMFVVDECR